MDPATVIASAGVTVSGLVAAWFTRRSSRETTAVGGFTELTRGLQQQLEWQATRTTEAVARIDHLERVDRARRRLARRHEAWDQAVVAELSKAGIEVPEPPPLEIEQEGN